MKHPTKMRRCKIVACILLIIFLFFILDPFKSALGAEPYGILILSIFGFVHAAPAAVQEVRGACADAVDRGDDVIIGSGKRAEIQEEVSSSAPDYASGTHPNSSFSSGES